MKQAVYWYLRRAPSEARRLDRDLRSDVVIVGGGMAGLSCARRLLAGGVSVTVVEREFCGAGASGKSSGFITPASEIDLRSLIQSHGPEPARRMWEFVSSGVEEIRSNILGNGFECDYQLQDSLFVADNRLGRRSARSEHAGRLLLGYPSRLYEGSEVQGVLGTTRYDAAVRYGQTFAIDPYAYCQALRERLVSAGADIRENSPVVKLDKNGVVTPDGSVRAGHVVVCTDRFLPDLGVLQDEIFHVQTFLAISTPLVEADLHRLFPGGRTMTWDSALVYNYFRSTGDGRLMLGGGDLLHTYASSPQENLTGFVRRAVEYFRTKFPDIRVDIDCAWSGMLGVSKDLLPIMGPDPVADTVWYVGAATGLPWAAALGVYAAERILEGRADLDEAFSPNRRFVIGSRLQAVLSKPLTYAICHGIAKLS